ncbi:ABC transporter permease [Zhaonella formicivorans]|uniref:ABC transporter permease n=1 Tax=Zhaonella formicivorans TaxID=2528593 RepID=UPI0010D23A0F
MVRYLLRRFVAIFLALVFISTFTFFGMKAIPGGPFASEKKLPPKVEENLNKKYHLNDPLLKQYKDYMFGLAKGDLGPSFKYPDRTVNDIIKDGFPVSAILGAISVLLALSVGLSAGIISALKQNHWQDHVAMILATIGFSVPSFVLAALLQFVFSYKLNWVVPAMWGTWQQTILPSISLAALPSATIARLMRSSMLEVLQQDYIRTAKAKGLKDRVIIYRHAVRNAVMPIITYLGPLIAATFTGSFVVEFIFAIPGLGRYFVTSVFNRDYTLIMGLTIFYSVFLMAMNLIVDLSYAIIDPRVKLTGGKE